MLAQVPVQGSGSRKDLTSHELESAAMLRGSGNVVRTNQFQTQRDRFRHVHHTGQPVVEVARPWVDRSRLSRSHSDLISDGLGPHWGWKKQTQAKKYCGD